MARRRRSLCIGAIVALAGLSRRATAQPDLPPAIRARGTLLVGTSPNTPPITFLAEDNQTIVGLEPDLAAEIARRLGLRLSMMAVSFDQVLTGLRSGRFDIGMSSLADLPQRRAIADFVNYLKHDTLLVVAAGNPRNIRGRHDLCGLNVGTLSGSDAERQFREISAECTARGRAALNISSFRTAGISDVQIASGRLDASASSAPRATFITARSEGRLELAPGVVLEEGVGGAVLPKGSALRPAVRWALEAMLADGSYAAILARWNLGHLALARIGGDAGD